MKMEDLNKTQIVLLTLLISFMTSIATGIVTVTLLDQAPPSVTRTINRVVEKTIQTVIPGENKVTTVVKKIIVREKDLLVGVVEKASKSLVQVDAVDPDGKNVSLGIGIVVSADGFVVTDKDIIAGNHNNLSISKNGKSMNVEIVSTEKDFVILHAKKVTPKSVSTKSSTTNKSTDKNIKTKNTNLDLVPISLTDSSSVKLGQTVIALGGSAGDTVFKGIVSRLDTGVIPVISTKSANSTNAISTSTKQISDSSAKTISKDKDIKTLQYIIPSFKMGKQSAGGPLLNTDGSLIGINVVVSDGEILSVPSNDIEKSLLNITKNLQKLSSSDKNLGNKLVSKSKDLTNTK